LAVITARSVRRLDDAFGRSDLKIIVFRAGCSYRQRLESMLAAFGVVGIRCLQFATLEGILGCVGADVGLTLLPKAIVEPARQQGQVAVHNLAPSDAWVDTVFIRRRDSYVSSALVAFLELARNRLPAQAAA
jgi:LysR family transcriptional regulator, cell division regulator